MRRATAAAAVLLLLAPGMRAQEDFFPEEFVIGSGGINFPGASSTAEEDEEPDTPRKRQLSQLKFDRRPSAILSAWSTPAPERIEVPPEPEEEGEEQRNAEAEEAPVAADPEATAPASEEEVSAPSPEELAATAEEKRLVVEAKAKRAELGKRALEVELELFQRSVTLGEWDEVRSYFAGLSKGEARAGYTRMLSSLIEGPPQPNSPFRQYAEKNFYAPADIRGLTAAAPFELEDAELAQLGLILQQCVAAGNDVRAIIGHFRAGLELGEVAPDRRTVAKVLFAAALPIEGGEFLPSFDEARAADDRGALNLLSRHFVALHGEDSSGGHLERAWWALQAVLAADAPPEGEPGGPAGGELPVEIGGETVDTSGIARAEAEAEARDKERRAEKQAALQLAVDLAPQIRAELGQAWLDESFTARPERGMEILSVIGSASAAGMVEHAHVVDLRLECLELQTTATDALLRAAPELAGGWRPALNLLASNWLTEALYTYEWDQSTRRGPNLQRDVYGNFFWYDNAYRYNGNMPEPITTDKVLAIRPSDAWLALVDDGLRPKFDSVYAQLLLKVGDEDEAFPYIERLAGTQPDDAEELVAEFLRVWARNHDPNTASNRTSSYMFMYGFEERANAIPLTRSKQERNLEELADLVVRLRALPLEELDEELLASCFTSAHSTAEVYRLETIERVFGEIEELEPSTLASLVQRMRGNLSGVWREPSVQKDAKTKRRQKDMQAEVLRGYEVARAVVEQALAEHPDDWSLRLARAAVLHDENDYLKEIELSPDFAARRREAFGLFREAAEAYAAALPELDEEDESSDVYTTWLYASLGACDLAAIDHEKQPVESELAAIRESVDNLPGEAAERHRAMFANTLYTRMSSVNPAVKYRYVRAGLEIAGDHERAREAREVYEYYRDLVTEIRLETAIDGSDRVGSGRPFGLFVSLRHTREIEREAGGFSKYLVNQNNQTFAYNYGRPTENYRDKFEEAARESLAEHFEVLSVTFEEPSVTSRAEPEYGWRVTPYAYVLLQARGPEVDRIPSLRFDLDFLDTTGYALLPVESAPLPIDASGAAEERPYRQLALTQTLDERQANKGKLVLEVQARALGLVPDLPALLDVASEGFEVASVDDQGVSVERFDEEAGETAVASERTWLVSLRAAEGLDELPASFAFAAPRVEADEIVYQRYDDADLETVGSVVPLEHRYGKAAGTSILGWIAAAAVVLVVGGAGWFWAREQRRAPAEAARFLVPEQVSAFTVIGLLRDIESSDGFAIPEREELRRQIDAIERRYFDRVSEADASEAADLREIAELWVRRAR